jgi:hypothetical protein
MNKDKLDARSTVVNYLTEQILGPTQFSKSEGVALPKPSSNGKVFISAENKDSVFFDEISGDPILQNIRPEMMFGTGIIHAPDFELEPVENDELKPSEESENKFTQPDVPEIHVGKLDDATEDSFEIDQSQKIRPGAMGLTCQFVATGSTKLKFTVKGSTYEAVKVTVEGVGDRTWYRRKAHSSELVRDWSSYSESSNKLIPEVLSGELGRLGKLQVQWRNTQISGPQDSVVALTAVVAHEGDPEKDDIFQFQLKVSLVDDGAFKSVDNISSSSALDDEEQEVEFLYRHVKSYAVGHGISVNWDESEEGVVSEVWTESIPVFYQERIDTGLDGVNIQMKDLFEGQSSDIRATLQTLVDGLDNWLSDESRALAGLDEQQIKIGDRLLDKNRKIKNRMQRGLDLLFDPANKDLLQAFRLTNQAMHLQQKHGRIPVREFADTKGQKINFPPIKFPEEGKFGNWRPFQIGFLLMTLEGLVFPTSEDREIVDLIFFPTGGGKTEAYLGAAALVMIYRRLVNKGHHGVDVLMRYTLRLLTVQQFERSSGLIVALEHLRRARPELLGGEPFSIGVWLGDRTTPNKRKKAIEILEGKGDKEESANPFILGKCPWCGASFARRESNKTWVGYKKSSDKPHTLKFICGDEACEFSLESKALPIWITDDDVYDHRPSFVLGTVDKFAQIAWDSKTRAIFNIDSNGDRLGLPPALVIQDELHLISGPLGSMVGLYETVIEELCSESIGGVVSKPKIIASTATTRRYQEQILSLYGRPKVTLFPQAVSRANETYFSKILKGADGKPERGTSFVGINPATYATGQLSASQITAFLSQAPSAWEGEQRSMDFYSTSVWFFNSLKELGQTLTLMQSTVVSLLNQMWMDRRLPGHKTRSLEPFKELTGRVSSAQVTKSLADLAISNDSSKSIRTCLASSIMEVGVDVQRLGLLTIMSQPKSTSQYIQVAGRVGRNSDGPGLVVMLYNASRARDRSVYEHFMHFHRRLYAQVEPLSATPFSIQAMEKGLWGAMIAMYRMLGNAAETPHEMNLERFEKVVNIFRVRLQVLGLAGYQLEDLDLKANALKKLWLRYKPAQWVYDFSQELGTAKDYSTAFLRRREVAPAHILDDSSILIPQSMRNVDGQTSLIPATNAYNLVEEQGE